MKYILKCSKCNSEDLQAIEHVVNDIKQKDMYICNECSELMEPEEVAIAEFNKHDDNMNVYVALECHDYSHNDITKIFKSKEDAEKFKKDNEEQIIEDGADEIKIVKYNLE